MRSRLLLSLFSRCCPLGLSLWLPVMTAGVATAGPVVCTTTLEAPVSLAGAAEGPLAAPVEVTRCAAVQTTPDLVRQRFFSYTAPFERGIDITHQITDLLGIAMGGGDGTRVMGLGFPDQTIVWDGAALQNTTRVLMEQQSDPMPWRTADLPNGFPGSLGSAGGGQGSAGGGQASTWAADSAPVVRGLW